jgi:plastocyanin
VTVFVITKDNQGNLIFLPNSAAIKPGEEIFVLNNETKPHTVLNGNGPDDSLSGKPFSIGAVKPKAFLEYRASNLPDGISFLFAI